MHGSTWAQGLNTISGTLWRIGRILDLRGSARLNQIRKHQQNSNGDTGIGDIECRPMISSIIKIEKIDHFLVQNPIDQVADRSAENQNQPNPNHSIFLRRLMKKYQNGNNGNDRKPDEQIGLVFGRSLRKQAKRHPGIANMSDREKIVYHRYIVMFRNMGINPHFGILIQNDQNVGSQE